jgi:hypothetical protein
LEYCSNCGRVFSGEYCASCNVGSPAYKQDFPNVSWAEVRDHLVKRLLIDDVSIVHGEEEYRWWPAFLCQRVFKETEGRFNDESPDNWMQIVAETEIGRMGEELGIRLADEVNSEFPFGAAIFNEGVLKLRTAFAFNPLNRSLLKIFHEQVLVQATVAHEFAIRWRDIGDIEFAYSDHPESGPREKADDLLGVFWGETYSGGEITKDFPKALDDARHLIPALMLKDGWEQGFSNHEVNFFMRENTSIGIGVRPGDQENQKFGPGVFIYANDLNFQLPIGADESNFLNWLASDLQRNSQFGSFVSKSYIGELGPRLTAFIPYGPLAEDRANPLNMAITITNMAAHVSNSCAGAFWLLQEAQRSESTHSDDSTGV